MTMQTNCKTHQNEKAHRNNTMKIKGETHGEADATASNNKGDTKGKHTKKQKQKHTKHETNKTAQTLSKHTRQTQSKKPNMMHTQLMKGPTSGRTGSNTTNKRNSRQNSRPHTRNTWRNLRQNTVSKLQTTLRAQHQGSNKEGN